MADEQVRGERDRWLAPALLIAGVIALSYALLHRWNAQEMNPGVEGAVTVGVFAPMLLLLHGLGFAEMLKGVIPIWIVQFVTCAMVSGPAIAGLGIDLCVTGAVGILVGALVVPSRAPASPGARCTSAGTRRTTSTARASSLPVLQAMHR